MVRAMVGDGGYDNNSEYQMRAAQSYAEVVRDAAAGVSPGTAGSVTLADYGCAQGRVSMPLLTGAVEVIRGNDPTLPIFVCHNDQPSNDWDGLFERLNGDDAYLQQPGGPITPLAAITSFCNPVLRAGTVNLGVSFAAAQWLEEAGPSDGTDAIYFDQLAAEAANRMAEQAHQDWTRFLNLRVDELTDDGDSSST